MNNPMDMIKLIKNPQKFVLNMLGGNNNPIMNNLKQMANDGNQKGVEEFARNLFKQNNRDFDKEFKEFMDTIKG